MPYTDFCYHVYYVLIINKFFIKGDDGSQDNYVPEDLISLLDAGINADHPSVIIDADAMFSEDMFGYSQRRSSSSNRYF